MTTIVLVRHAATAWSGSRYLGRTDLPLTPAGVEAARATAERLAATVPVGVRIVTSPSQRTHETALIVATALVSGAGASRTPVAVETDPGWAEADVGAADGLTFEDLAERFPTLARRLAAGDTAIDWPAGETAADFHARVSVAWTAVVMADRPTIVVTHAGPIRVAMALASGRAVSEIALLEPAGAVHLEVDAAVHRDGRIHGSRGVAS